MRHHGYSKRCAWHKLHLALNANRGVKCVAALMTHQDVANGEALLHKSSLRTQWNKLRTLLVGNLFVSPKIMPFDAIASSRSIYATTPLSGLGLGSLHRPSSSPI
ncbi:MAG: hypothetical protein VB140_00315 [Burkholderia sp.]